MDEQVRRRAYLSYIAASGLLAGCTSNDSQAEQENQSTTTAIEANSPTATETEVPEAGTTETAATETSTSTKRPTETPIEEETETPTEASEETKTPAETEESTETPEPTETEDPTEMDSTPDQPKIREVQDNFGNTFTFDRDSGGSVQVDDEIVVNDATEVELCVTEVADQPSDDVYYSYWFGNSQADHPSNTAGDARIEENCWSWDMQREDYASHWGFSIWIRNDDEIYYQNDAVESDYRVVIHYNNLTLEDSETDSESGSGPGQPKVREVQDNFGNTFTFGGDSGDSVQVDDEIVVSDETEVELCVTDIAKQSDDNVYYSYWFGNSQSEHQNNTAGDARIEESCWRWDMEREDYSSHWGFSIWIRNEDEIYYQNDAVESDYRVVIHYNNLTLED